MAPARAQVAWVLPTCLGTSGARGVAQLKSFPMLGHQLVCSSSAQGACRILLLSGILSLCHHGAHVCDSFCHR